MFSNSLKSSYKTRLFRHRRFHVCLHLWGRPWVCLMWETTNVLLMTDLPGETLHATPQVYRAGRLLGCRMEYRR